MKLSKLYANQSNVFEPIIFNDGLNIILGEIRLKENKNKDTHNLGKSTLGHIIDFCLLKGRDRNSFIFKNQDLFGDFIFFLEVKINDKNFLTIKRAVKDNTRVAIHKHNESNQNFITLPDQDWIHSDFKSFDRSKKALDSLLNLSFIKPWDFRQAISYALRSEYDYKEVFKLPKFHNDIDWKPYIAHILGLNYIYVCNQYTIKKRYDDAKKKINEIRGIPPEFIDKIDKLEGLVLIKEDEIKNIEESLSNFDFKIEDESINHELVDNLEKKLAESNKKRYYLSRTVEKIANSLEKSKIIFNLEEASKLFAEAGVLFDGQIKKTYEQLIQFNSEITEERKILLERELEEKIQEIRDIENEIKILNEKRVKALQYLESQKTFEKYKILSNKLIDKKSHLKSLKQQREIYIEYEKLKMEKKQIKEELELNEKLLTENLNNNLKDSIYASIRLSFNNIIEELLDKAAVISININKEGNLEFQEAIINNDGKTTNESDGKTYKKLLCMAFDIAVNQIHCDKEFSHFTFHDGFLENLEARKKIKFIDLIRKITKNGYQYIGTIIDSDLPNQDKSIFSENEIILTLHDDKNGTLFKGLSW